MKPKVLMLGWEFPPVVSGGLGVACLGIAKALSKFVDLTISHVTITNELVNSTNFLLILIYILCWSHTDQLIG